MASKSVTFRLKSGSALERLLNSEPAQTVTDRLHELAAAHEVARMLIAPCQALSQQEPKP